jgi:hypothetical protein
MNDSAHFFYNAPVFEGRILPEKGSVVGYAALIWKLGLKMPIPDQIALITLGSKKYTTEEFIILTKTYSPEDNQQLSEIHALYNQLVFSLKYEGVNLLFFKKLIEHYNENQLAELVSIERTGQYSRRMWFLIEWLSGKKLPGINDISKRSYVFAVDPKIQYALSGVRSTRHMVFNNLPGTIDFCPLVRKTSKLEAFIEEDLSMQKEDYLRQFQKNLLRRASSFLLLKDSKASFSIEGESPKSRRTARWGQAIGQAGLRDLNLEEFSRLQQLVIENERFIKMGLRDKGGFVGEHDRFTGEPMPDHISAKHEDLYKLMTGLIETSKILINQPIDAVVAASKVAFGFVFIHPFVDGNGRVHRYLIHHILAKKNFTHQGFIFPVSAAILDRIRGYQEVLEAYSKPLLDFIEWEETADHNVRVLNQTIDFYRYIDLTRQTEFLYECVKETLVRIIPEEVSYLSAYEQFKAFMDNRFEMPDSTIALLVRFLEQNEGKLSKRARTNEFKDLSIEEIEEIELSYEQLFLSK